MVRFVGRLRTFLDDWFHPVAVTMGVLTLLAVMFLQVAFGASAQQKVFPSAQGKRDGLYWESKTGEEPSRFGSLAARARAEGYKSTAGKPAPYHATSTRF